MSGRGILDRAREKVLRDEAREKEKSPRGGRTVGSAAAEPGLPLEYYIDISPVLDAADFVEDLLIEGAMSVVYGDSNCGKTFLLLDLALHVAAGIPWHGREVKKGGVLYLALEGGHGIRNRVSAFKQAKNMNAVDLPFAIVPVGLNLLDPVADTHKVIDTVKAVADRMQLPVLLVVVDTLARAIAGGNENSEDMGALVNNADWIRRETGAHVSFIHHSGKDASRGARGNSSLRAATDTEIEVSRDHSTGLSVMRVTKQRDLPLEGEFAFRLQSVELGTNARGKPVTSCTVIEAEVVDPPGPKLRGDQARAFSILSELITNDGETGATGLPVDARSVHVETWRQAFYRRAKAAQTPEARRQAFGRAVNNLDEAGLIRTLDDRVWIP